MNSVLILALVLIGSGIIGMIILKVLGIKT